MSAVTPESADAGRGPFLHRLNPLAKVAAVLPAMAVLLFTRNLLSPLAFVVLAVVVIFAGTRLRPGIVVGLLVALPLIVAAMAVSFGLWADASHASDPRILFSIGAFDYTEWALAVGLATSLRLASLVMLALIGGLTTTGPDLARSMVQQLRVPYRIGYTAIAAYRFIPRFGSELALIRQAQRVRGVAGGWGPIAAARRAFAAVVPLLASAIRHADRMALAMESRAFGAHPTRTERHPTPWRVRDTVFVLLFWVVTGAILAITLTLAGAAAGRG
ncbi:energy-coupling factor transporter transmembrane component T family protein [Leifsonia sp. NPDC058292]|uniref:energy-coupling factor transporter transmembrane component T family protein n=1 Tax=Leifsonia sp. NPDC058292 TaxID=3346428 RepID=UPI0036DEE293